MFERILVPLDGSPLAECTLPHAVHLGNAFGSVLHLLTVTEAPPPLADEVDSAEWRMARAEVQGYLNRLAEELGDQGVRASPHVLEGDAPTRALDLAREIRADIVPLSRHARGGVTDFPMSGTAFKIVSGACTSVLLVRAAGFGGQGDETYRRVLAPVDCSKRSDWSAHVAGVIARSAGAELVLAAVVPVPELLGEASEWEDQTRLARQLVERNRETAARHLDTLRQNLQSDDLTVRCRTLEAAEVGRALQRIETEESPSLIVVSAHGRSGDVGWSYGSVTKRLLDHAVGPLMVLQDLRMHSGRHSSGARRRPYREPHHA
jgi:nucleotide-binding universal stress UspA family protein